MPANTGRAGRSGRDSACVLLCALLLLGADGCVSRQAVRPDTFDVGESGDIQVFLKGRRMIEFTEGSYGTVDSAGTRYIVGNGIDHRPDSSVVRVPFSGYIAFPSIERIEKQRTEIFSALYVTFFIGIFAVIGFGSDITD